MSTAVAATPVSAPHAPTDSVASGRTYAAIAPLTSSPHNGTPLSRSSKLPAENGSPTNSHDGLSQQQRGDGKRSPLSSRTHSSSKFPPSSMDQQAPKIIVKKEPSSPDLRATRRRPQHLDLSANNHHIHPSGALTARPSGPMSSRDNANSVHDLGMLCLSPGFHTQDPTMREQLQRSIDVRERQRQIIEARQKQGKGGQPDEEGGRSDMNSFGRPMKTPNTSRRKGPPPGLSIAPPSHQQFANERVIQSAPINQSFTGLRNTAPASRHVANGPSNLSQTSHIHHVPATQTNNRLPPISDVFPDRPRNPYNNSPGHSSHSNQQPPLPSPGFPPPHQQVPMSARRREYSSAEEAMQAHSGGRDDHLPRPVHYLGGHQPPTPPSPMPKQNAPPSYPPPHPEFLRTDSNSRRRGRDEYERDNGTPPLGRQQARSERFEDVSPEADRRRKDRFMSLVSEAWDLFHQK